MTTATIWVGKYANPLIIDGPAKGEDITISVGTHAFEVPLPREVTLDDLGSTRTLHDLCDRPLDTAVYYVHRVTVLGRTIAVASMRLHLSIYELFDALLPTGADKAVIS